MIYVNEALLTRPWLVQDGTLGIHSAVVRATGRAVVLESRAHLVSKYEVVYTSDPPARISDNRIQLFRTQHSVVSGNLDVNFSKCGVWPGAETGNRRQRPCTYKYRRLMLINFHGS